MASKEDLGVLLYSLADAEEARCKIRVPPLKDDKIGSDLVDLPYCTYPIERVSCVDLIVCIFDLEGIVTVISLLLLEQYLGILHLEREHSYIVRFT